jgi:hypothetical protein
MCCCSQVNLVVQLVVIKTFTDILWGLILDLFGTYYESLQGEIHTILKLSIPIDSFEDCLFKIIETT